jgi:hypothetical protein
MITQASPGALVSIFRLIVGNFGPSEGGRIMWRQIAERCREAAIVWLLEKWRRAWR